MGDDDPWGAPSRAAMSGLPLPDVVSEGPADPWDAHRAPATGRYGPPRPVGEGGMGRVDAVFDHVLGREVARKTLTRLDHPALAQRLVREARLTARLDHPGIVPVYDAGLDAAGRPWYTMRLVRGRPLAEAVAQAPSAEARRALLPRVLSACQAVAAAHAAGVVHRDLKPDNVLLGPFDETLVADWGLARHRSESGEATPEGTPSADPSLTSFGAVVGTPRWMAPEQAAGQEAGPPADVWALGLLLRFVWTGAPDGPLAGLPADLVAVIERSTRPDPADRYPDAGGLAQDLQAWLDGRLVEAHDYSVMERVRRAWPRLRLPVGIATVATLTLAAGLWVAFDRTAAERDRALDAEHRLSDTLARTRAGLAEAAFAKGDLATTLAALSSSEAVTPTPTGRLLRAALGTDPVLPVRARWAHPPATAAHAHADGRIGLRTPQGPRLLEQPDAPAVALDAPQDARLWLSDDGTAVTVGTTQLTLHEPGGSRALATSGHNVLPIGALASGWLLQSTGAGVSLTRTTAEGPHSRSVRCPQGAVGDGAAAVWSGDRWLTLCGDGWIRVHDGPMPGEPLRQLMADGVPMSRVVSAARVGERLVLGDLDGGVWMVEDGGTGRLYGPWLVGDAPVLSLKPSADGRFAAASLGDHSVALIDVLSHGSVAGLPPPVLATAFPAPGILRVVTDREILDLGLPSPDTAPPVLWASEGLSALEVGPNGPIASGDGDGRVVVRRADGVVLADADLGGHAVKDVAWSAEGTWVAAGTPHRGPVRLHPGQPLPDELPREGLRRVGTLADGRLLVGGYDNRVRVHRDGAPSAPRTMGLPIAMRPSLDRRRLLHGSATTWARLWEVDQADPVVLMDGAERGRIGLSGSGRRWAFVGAGPGGVFELPPVGTPVDPPGRRIATLPPQGDVTAVTLDTTGDRLIVGTLSGDVRVLRISDGAVLAEAHLHTRRVSALSLGPGNVVWTAGWDRRIHRIRLDLLDLETAWAPGTAGSASTPRP